MRYKFSLYLILLVLSRPLSSQITPRYLSQFLGTTKANKEYSNNLKRSRSGNAFDLMYLRSQLGANNALVGTDFSKEAINYQVQLISNIINSSEESRKIKNNHSPFKDSFYGWISKVKNRELNNEVPLYESYAFFYITEFLYYTKQNGWRSSSKQNEAWWNKTLDFVERNIWQKWYTRSVQNYRHNYSYFIRSRTHMGAHWAGIARYLSLLSKNQEINKQTAIVIKQYDSLLRRNLKIYNNAYIWNSSYDNIKNTYALSSHQPIIQDVAHGNHVISYVVSAYELGGTSWTLMDLERFSNTLKIYVYDKENNIFRDNVDGSIDPSARGRGNFVADGWVKLAKYDKELELVFERFSKSDMLQELNQEVQFKSVFYNSNYLVKDAL